MEYDEFDIKMVDLSELDESDQLHILKVGKLDVLSSLYSLCLLLGIKPGEFPVESCPSVPAHSEIRLAEMWDLIQRDLERLLFINNKIINLG